MADIVKEIQSLGGEIDSLRKKISDYDKQISNSGKSVANIERLFASYKGLDASVMSVKELTKATKELTNGYNSLTAARDGYVGKESATLELIQKLAEQNKVLAAAQREALRYGDQQGATEIYQQYVANSQAIRQYQTELDKTRSELEALEEQTNKVSKASDNFAIISQAAKKANSTKDIAELVGLYKQEVTEVKGINEQIQDYSQKYKAALAAVKGGKLTPEQMDEKTMELEGYKNKLDELSNAYSVAAQRARIFANAAGENTAGIPQMAAVPMELKPKQVEFPQIKELQKEIGNASEGLDGLLKKGAKLGGLTYGAHKLKEFAQQVMSIRSEFQQLEVAFSTLLGSEQKANKLMAQLTKTAATTPFDLQSVSRGAKQLLAYGTAAEDVNDILVHLGDIAAGLSQPLDALVYLYGTTMVQGRMMTMDLRQFQNRGIPIAEELAKQFGVAKSEVQGLVSSGRVTAEEFHKAIMAMSSDGGKFGGLMAAQAKTIGGQISNIQDNISMMFNEIGKKSEGVINAGLGAVATLVENYETVGKTILALIATYGTYKTALVVVTALEKAKAATALYNLVSGQKAISVTKMLTTATWKQVKAQLASNAAMLSNPAIWITTAIVGLVAGTIAMARALDSERKAQDKLNQSKKEQQELLENAKSESDSAISTLQSETATAYEKAKAYDTLKSILPQLTNEYSQAQLASMGLEAAQKAQAQALEDLKFEEKRKEIERYRAEVARLQKESSNDYIDTNKTDAHGNPVYNHGNAISNANLLATQEAQKQAEKELAQMEAERKKAQEQEDFQKLPIAKQIEQLKAKKKELQDQFDGLNFKAIRGIIHPLELTLLEQLKKDLAGLTTQIDTLEQTPNDLGKLTKQILDAEEAVDVARKTYAANMVEGNKKNVDTAVANLKTLTDKYKDATGQQWTATEQMLEQKTKEERKASRESEDIVAREYSKRYQLALQHQRELEDLDAEKKEWQKKNPNRAVPEYFEQRKEVIELKFKADFAKLDEEFNDWIEGIQRETVQIQTDVEISQLEQAIDLADDYNTKLEKREEINKKQIAAKNAELNLEKEQTAESQFNKQTVKDFATYNKETGKYVNKEGIEVAATDDEKVVFAQLERFYTEFENKRNAIIGQMKQDDAMQLLDEDLQRYEEYLQGILQAEQDYQDALANIRAANGLAEDANIEGVSKGKIKEQVDAAKAQRDRAQKEVTKETGVDFSKLENNLSTLAQLGANAAQLTFKEIEKKYGELISTIENDITSLEGQLKAEEKLGETEGEERVSQSQSLQAVAEASLESVNRELGSENITPERKNELLQEQLLLEGEIAYYKAVQKGDELGAIEIQARINSLTDARKQALQQQANASKNAADAESKQAKNIENGFAKTAEVLGGVADAADGIASTFGGKLSQSSKKVLGDISAIGRGGQQIISTIMTTAQSVMSGIAAATAATTTSMKTLESASVILTIISAVITVVQAIMSIAERFSKSAQLQEAIDGHKKKAEELRKENDKLQQSFKSKAGIDYYKGMTAAAKDMTKQIEALEEARAKAEEKKNEEKEGTDDYDKAAQQEADLATQLEQRKQDQIDQLKQVAEELATTDLKSFSQSLAESIVEGFAGGMDEVKDVLDDTLDDLYRSMLTKQLAMAFEKQFKGVFDEIEKRANDSDSFTQKDVEIVMGLMDKASEGAEKISEAYYKLFEESGLLEDADAEGSEGFGQMTQDQADTLTARFTAVQIEMANVSATTQAMAGVVSLVGEDVKLGIAGIQSLLYNSNIALQMAQDQLDHLQVIADNTAMLTETNNRLKAIEQNTSKL